MAVSFEPEIHAGCVSAPFLKTCAFGKQPAVYTGQLAVPFEQGMPVFGDGSVEKRIVYPAPAIEYA